jgi:hypothetical protein
MTNENRQTQRAPETDRSGRREFLRAVGASPAVAAAGLATGASAAEPSAARLPQIQLGPHRVSRLVCGATPFTGGSHLSTFVNRQMKAYYTPEQILKTLKRCQEVGINCWQSSGANLELYRRFREEGGQMHYLSLDAQRKDGSNLQQLADAGAIGCAHHGEVTDRLFKDGRIDEVRDFLKKIRDHGLLVGVSTHMPDVVDTIESKDWDLDFYMTCVYERHRSAEALEALLGQAPIPVGEVYLPKDPPRMFKAIQATKRPCLAFKILAAGRLSDRRHWVEQAFRDTYASIKPTDSVIIGIYDQYDDQPADCAEMCRKYSGAGGA